RLARAYHVDRGEPDRWRVISPAQAYHGSTMATLALSGRTHTIQEPYTPYLPAHLHIPPSTRRFDPSGQSALDELDRRLEEARPARVSAPAMRRCARCSAGSTCTTRSRPARERSTSATPGTARLCPARPALPCSTSSSAASWWSASARTGLAFSPSWSRS